jgi:hypothetical protein
MAVSSNPVLKKEEKVWAQWAVSLHKGPEIGNA